MVPKSHWLLHLPSVLSRFSKLLNCFCLERKHRVAKRYATDLTKTKSGSQSSLLKEVTNHHFGQLQQPDSLSFDVGLVDPKAPSRALKLMFKPQLSMTSIRSDGAMKQDSAQWLHVRRVMWFSSRLQIMVASRLA